MYSNTEKQIVKRYSGGLGQDSIVPDETMPTRGSRYLFVFDLARVIYVSEWTNIKSDFSNPNFGKEATIVIPFITPTAFYVDSVVHDPSTEQIRVYVKTPQEGLDFPGQSLIDWAFPYTMGNIQAKIEGVFNKRLGKGVANVIAAYFLTGIKKSTPVTKGTRDIIKYAALIGAAYFLIPPIIRELRKKQ